MLRLVGPATHFADGRAHDEGAGRDPVHALRRAAVVGGTRGSRRAEVRETLGVGGAGRAERHLGQTLGAGLVGKCTAGQRNAGVVPRAVPDLIAGVDADDAVTGVGEAEAGLVVEAEAADAAVAAAVGGVCVAVVTELRVLDQAVAAPGDDAGAEVERVSELAAGGVAGGVGADAIPGLGAVAALDEAGARVGRAGAGLFVVGRIATDDGTAAVGGAGPGLLARAVGDDAAAGVAGAGPRLHVEAAVAVIRNAGAPGSGAIGLRAETIGGQTDPDVAHADISLHMEASVAGGRDAGSPFGAKPGLRCSRSVGEGAGLGVADAGASVEMEGGVTGQGRAVAEAQPGPGLGGGCRVGGSAAAVVAEAEAALEVEARQAGGGFAAAPEAAGPGLESHRAVGAGTGTGVVGAESAIGVESRDAACGNAAAPESVRIGVDGGGSVGECAAPCVALAATQQKMVGRVAGRCVAVAPGGAVPGLLGRGGVGQGTDAEVVDADALVQVLAGRAATRATIAACAGEARGAVGGDGAGLARDAAAAALVDDAVAVVVATVTALHDVHDHAAREGEPSARVGKDPGARASISRARRSGEIAVGPRTQTARRARDHVAVLHRIARRRGLGEDLCKDLRLEGRVKRSNRHFAAEERRGEVAEAGLVVAGALGDQFDGVCRPRARHAVLHNVHLADALLETAERGVGRCIERQDGYSEFARERVCNACKLCHGREVVCGDGLIRSHIRKLKRTAVERDASIGSWARQLRRIASRTCRKQHCGCKEQTMRKCYAGSDVHRNRNRRV